MTSTSKFFELALSGVFSIVAVAYKKGIHIHNLGTFYFVHKAFCRENIKNKKEDWQYR